MTGSDMERGSDDAAEQFLALYGVKFGTHPASRRARDDDGVARRERAMWRAEIDKIEPRHFEQVIELLALAQRDGDRRRQRPNLDEVRAAAGKFARRGQSATAPSRLACAICYGSGIYSIPAAAPTRQRAAWVIGDPSVLLTHYAFPCRCSDGAKRMEGRAIMSGMEKELARRAWEYHLACLEECGTSDAERDMTLREFLALDYGGQSCMAMYADVIVESIRREAERHGHDTEQLPRDSRARTLELLKAKKCASVAGIVAAAAPGVDPVEREEREAIESEGAL